jgi:hypothetical protein
MVGYLGGGQEDAQEVLDLPQAQAHGEGGGRQLLLPGRVAPDRDLGVPLQLGDPLAQALILGPEFGHRFSGGLGRESLLQLAGVLIDRLAATSGLFGLLGDSAVLPGEDGGGVADPGAQR